MKRQWLSWVLVRIQWKHWMMLMETFPVRLQETGAAFSRLQITRRRLRKEASWGYTSVSLNAVTTVPHYPLNFMPSKHNLLKLKKNETSDFWHGVRSPKCREWCELKVWYWVCELYQWKGALKLWGTDNDKGTSWLFAFQVSRGMHINQCSCTEKRGCLSRRMWVCKHCWCVRIPKHVRCSATSDSCDPMDSSLPGYSVHGMLQARQLEWVVISYSRWSSWPRDRAQLSCISSNAKQIFYCRAT